MPRGDPKSLYINANQSVTREEGAPLEV